MRKPAEGKKVGKTLGKEPPPHSTLVTVLASPSGHRCSQFLAGNRNKHEPGIITNRGYEADARFLGPGLFLVGGALMSKPRSVHDPRSLVEWQFEETQAALGEAEAGDFSPEEDVEAVFEKWAMSGCLSALDRLADEREQELDERRAQAIPVEDALARLEARFRRQS